MGRFGQIVGNIFKVSPGQTGNSVCQQNNRKCIGFTTRDPNVCKQVHPNAQVQYLSSGAKSPFYCDGPPDQGICRGLKNTCGVCPACNVNADCNWSPVGVQFREMYVECGPNDVAQKEAAAREAQRLAEEKARQEAAQRAAQEAAQRAAQEAAQRSAQEAAQRAAQEAAAKAAAEKAAADKAAADKSKAEEARQKRRAARKAQQEAKAKEAEASAKLAADQQAAALKAAEDRAKAAEASAKAAAEREAAAKKEEEAKGAETRYLLRYPDVAMAVKKGVFASGREHFEAHGKREGRVFQGLSGFGCWNWKFGVGALILAGIAGSIYWLKK